MHNRSLWHDEAAFAVNIVFRNWPELFTPPLSNNQSAPIIYLLFVKLIGSMFNYSEFSLRLYSYITFFGLLVSLFLLFKHCLKYSYYQISLIITLTALLPGYIWYSNELKPYMGDAFFIILSLLIYFYYTNKNITLTTLTTLYVLILGFSTPSIFFIGGILIIELYFSLLKNNKMQVFFIFISGMTVFLIFLLYYNFWLSSSVNSMKSYWDNNFSILNIIKNIATIFSGAGNSDSSIVWFFIPFSILGLYHLIKIKNKIGYSVLLSLILIISTASFGYWPVSGRLWMFLPVIVLVFVPVGIEYVRAKIKYEKIINSMEIFLFSAIVLILFIISLGFLGNKMYLHQQEINPLISYVQKNIKEDEKIYIYPMARYAFEYKNNLQRSGSISNDKIIFGTNRAEWNEETQGKDLQSVINHEKVYLIFQHHWTGIENGLNVLRDYGTLTKVMDVYDTPLYYFERYPNLKLDNL